MDEPSGVDIAAGTDTAPFDLAKARRSAADIWSDLAFDAAALARLKRDSLDLRDVRLTGPIPFMIERGDDGSVAVTIISDIDDHEQIATLLDLWRLHFSRGIRLGGPAPINAPSEP